MKEKKNIDRLFQEKFKNFEAHPSDRVWAGIAQNQKKLRSGKGNSNKIFKKGRSEKLAFKK